jgi:hypothetical protein
MYIRNDVRVQPLPYPTLPYEFFGVPREELTEIATNAMSAPASLRRLEMRENVICAESLLLVDIFRP